MYILYMYMYKSRVFVGCTLSRPTMIVVGRRLARKLLGLQNLDHKF